MKEMDGGRVWKRFERVLNDGSVKKFKIQQITKDMYEDVARFMLENFLPEEPTSMATGILDNPEELDKLKNIWINYVMPKNLSIACWVENDGAPPEMVGINLLVVALKDKEELPERPRAMIDMMRYIESQYNIFKSFGVDAYLTGFGLSVMKKYRGMNIGTAMLLVRDDICRDLGLKMTATIFGSAEGQRAAEKAGMSKHFEITYDILAEKFNCKFPERFNRAILCYKIIN